MISTEFSNCLPSFQSPHTFITHTHKKTLNTMSTICAPATAPGGAIAVVRVSGPEAVAITSRIFSKDITQAKGYSLHYGNIHAFRESGAESTPHTTGSDAIIDDVLVSVFRAPHSYTGEDST